MDQELAVGFTMSEALASQKAGIARGSDRSGNGDAIDSGPFLRQEGRPLTWDDQSPSPREDLIHSLRLELGFPTDPSLPPDARRVDQPRHQPGQWRGRHITWWMGSFFQKIGLR